MCTYVRARACVCVCVCAHDVMAPTWYTASPVINEVAECIRIRCHYTRASSVAFGREARMPLVNVVNRAAVVVWGRWRREGKETKKKKKRKKERRREKIKRRGNGEYRRSFEGVNGETPRWNVFLSYFPSRAIDPTPGWNDVLPIGSTKINIDEGCSKASLEESSGRLSWSTRRGILLWQTR